MMEILASKAKAGKEIILTLRNGIVLTGKIISLGDAYILIETKRGLAGV
ncbi:MAG: hypothetical protein PHD41_00520 [Methanosarcinaceae archaeon]|nr:hypothetical protein [Methanosarcinaceae archaeon]MDD4331269.1 hypothetical protein [Methanosarcinaceae archaeon]MDD4748451.1 hypothetical protein [Methanosarcinaceae archaeon]